jgi:hypothetical protein
MKRSWNWPLWIGFLFCLAGFLGYPLFIQFPITRDVPWANFLLLGLGAILLAVGLKRAFGQPDLYRGKIFGPILTGLGLVAIAFFSYLIFFELKKLPASARAPHVGDKAPGFSLLDQKGKPVALNELISSAAPNGKSGSALLIFYRGFW